MLVRLSRLSCDPRGDEQHPCRDAQNSPGCLVKYVLGIKEFIVFGIVEYISVIFLPSSAVKTTRKYQVGRG